MYTSRTTFKRLVRIQGRWIDPAAVEAIDWGARHVYIQLAGGKVGALLPLEGETLDQAAERIARELLTTSADQGD